MNAASTIKLTPAGQALGATVEGLDLANGLSNTELETVMQALGQYGVLRFPQQTLTAAQLKAFSAPLHDATRQALTDRQLATAQAIPSK